MIDLTSETRLVTLLEAVLAEQRRTADAQARLLAEQARTIAAHYTRVRGTLRALGILVYVVCTAAALAHAWPSLVWLFDG
jgi:hypothetical protein